MIEDYSRYAQKRARILEKELLKEAIISKDKDVIINYCYSRATSKELQRQFTELAIYGTTTHTMTEARCAELWRLMCIWYKRIMRLSNETHNDNRSGIKIK